MALFNKVSQETILQNEKIKKKIPLCSPTEVGNLLMLFADIAPPSPPRIHPIAIWATSSTYWYNGMGIVKISCWYLDDMGSSHILCKSGLKDLECSLRVCSRVASSSYLKIKIEQYQLFDQMHHRAASIFETYDSTPVANQQEKAFMTKRRPSQFIWCSNPTNLTRNQVIIIHYASISSIYYLKYFKMLRPSFCSIWSNICHDLFT